VKEKSRGNSGGSRKGGEREREREREREGERKNKINIGRGSVVNYDQLK